jgi:hypothetical protein
LLGQVPLFGWLQIFAFAGLIETSGFFSGKATAIGLQKDSTQDGEPGNYGVGFPNFIGKVTDPAARASKLNAELANGRLAMMAIIGMFFQAGAFNSVSMMDHMFPMMDLCSRMQSAALCHRTTV